MKIMMVTPYYAPRFGGVESYTKAIVDHLTEGGNAEVVVVTSEVVGQPAKEVKDGVTIYRLSNLVKFSNTPMNPFWYFRFKKLIRDEKPDVINAHTPVPFIADMAAWAKGSTKFVFTYHNDLVKPSGVGKYLAKLFYILFINHTLKVSDRIIATSDFYVQTSPYLQKYKSKISIVAPGEEPALYNGQLDTTWLAQKYPGKKVVLFAGSMDKSHAHKGVDVLIKAVAKAKQQVPDLCMVAVGKGDYIWAYKELAEGLGIGDSVNFTGFIPDEELALYFAGCSVFVLPSTTASEGFGMVAMEASACGAPVIGSRIGGVPFAVLQGETGEIVQPGSVEELSDAIVKIVTNPELAKRYGHAGAERARREFTWSYLADKTFKVFQDV